VYFVAVDGLKTKRISSVQLHEEVVLSAKAAIKKVLEANHLGPSK